MRDALAEPEDYALVRSEHEIPWVSAAVAPSAASLALFLVGAVVAGSAFGALVIGSLSAANRLARPQTRAKVISTYSCSRTQA